jgi:hypothetical protein
MKGFAIIQKHAEHVGRYINALLSKQVFCTAALPNLMDYLIENRHAGIITIIVS